MTGTDPRPDGGGLPATGARTIPELDGVHDAWFEYATPQGGRS